MNNRFCSGVTRPKTLYCKIAFDLATQGFTVLVSCHELVRVYFRKLKEDTKKWRNIPIVIFCPRIDMKEAWAIRLVERYNKSNQDKDFSALEGGIRYWVKNMAYMGEQGFPIYCPDSIDYDLRDYILQIRKKEGCNDEETSSSMEQMARVEESGLDVPVVEENSDTSRDHSE